MPTAASCARVPSYLTSTSEWCRNQSPLIHSSTLSSSRLVHTAARETLLSSSVGPITPCLYGKICTTCHCLRLSYGLLCILIYFLPPVMVGGSLYQEPCLPHSLRCLPAVQPCLVHNLHSVNLLVTIRLMFIVEKEELESKHNRLLLVWLLVTEVMLMSIYMGSWWFLLHCGCSRKGGSYG